MIDLRPSEARGKAHFGWLEARHSFSFGQYYDPAHMGFGPLRVINEDRIAPGGGFPPHGHENMEIVTYVLEGALEHKDSLGSGSVIRPGDVQRMSAGTGIRHSEFNASKTDPLHLLQIWLLPERNGITPGYEEKHFPPEERKRRLRLIASRDGREGSLTIHQDTDLYTGLTSEGVAVDHAFAPGRIGWLQVARGTLMLNGQQLYPGDGAAIRDETALTITGTSDDAEFLLFDMAA